MERSGIDCAGFPEADETGLEIDTERRLRKEIEAKDNVNLGAGGVEIAKVGDEDLDVGSVLWAEGNVGEFGGLHARGFIEVESCSEAALETKRGSNMLIDDSASGTGVYGEAQSGKTGDATFDDDEVAVVEDKGGGVRVGVRGIGGASGSGMEKNKAKEEGD